jgi:hypothetical protein
LTACDLDVVLGDEGAMDAAPDGASADLDATDAADSMDAARVGDGAEAGAACEDDSGAPVPWTATFETGDLSEFACDGWQYLANGGTISVTTAQAHSGKYSMAATISAPSGSPQTQAVMGKNVVLTDGAYGAWYYLPSTPTTNYWVILKVSTWGPETDFLDINIGSDSSGAPELLTYDHVSGAIGAMDGVPVPVGSWFHLVVLFSATPSSNGRVVVEQDGTVVINWAPQATTATNQMSLIVGSDTKYLVPEPYTIYIDDVTIDPVQPDAFP